jgi:hypothetical protein
VPTAAATTAATAATAAAAAAAAAAACKLAGRFPAEALLFAQLLQQHGRLPQQKVQEAEHSSSSDAPPASTTCSLAVPLDWCHSCGHPAARRSLLRCYYCRTAVHRACASSSSSNNSSSTSSAMNHSLQHSQQQQQLHQQQQHYCRAHADLLTNSLLQQHGVCTTTGDLVQSPYGAGAVGHGVCLTVAGSWRAAVVRAYRPLAGEHLLQLLESKHKGATLPEQLQWCVVPLQQAHWECVDAAVKGEVSSTACTFNQHRFVSLHQCVSYSS